MVVKRLFIALLFGSLMVFDGWTIVHGVSTGAIPTPSKYSHGFILRAHDPREFWFTVFFWVVIAALQVAMGLVAWRATDDR